MTLLVIYLVIAIGVSFMCSILEAVLLSVTPGFVQHKMENNPVRGKALQQVRENLDESISSILILNTFAHTMGAAGVGAQAVKVFGPKFETLVAFLLTLAILYLSEIIPKTLGATFWKQLALPAAVLIRGLVRLLFPLVWVSARLTNLFSGRGHGASVSRDELAALAKLGARHGALGPQESQLLENILQLRQTPHGRNSDPAFGCIHVGQECDGWRGAFRSQQRAIHPPARAGWLRRQRRRYGFAPANIRGRTGRIRGEGTG